MQGISKQFRMALLPVAAAAFFFASCNNNAPSAAATDSTANKRRMGMPADSATQFATYNFIEACVESSKASRPDEAKAFAYCKCMEAQIRHKYGNTDSLSVAALQNDTTTLKAFLQQCR